MDEGSRKTPIPVVGGGGGSVTPVAGKRAHPSAGTPETAVNSPPTTTPWSEAAMAKTPQKALNRGRKSGSSAPVASSAASTLIRVSPR